MCHGIERPVMLSVTFVSQEVLGQALNEKISLELKKKKKRTCAGSLVSVRCLETLCGTRQVIRM